MSEPDREIEPLQIVNVSVTPLVHGEKESGRLQKFVNSVLSFLQSKFELAEDFARAKKRLIDCEAEVKIQEAAKIAADRQTVDLQNVQTVIDMLEANLPESDSGIKTTIAVAALFDAKPELKAQLGRVADMLEDLRARRNTSIGLTPRGQEPDGEAQDQ